jgi:dienelactone hydrolase
MAHGLGGVREAGLEPFAERFAAAGFTVVVFDYAHFGGSTGEPRQLLEIGGQLDDWRAAVAYARSLESVDPERVAIWGTSFGGGHVITIAAEDHRLGAAIAQVPMADGIAAARRFGARKLVWSTGAGIRDEFARLRGRPPFYAPLTGPANGNAALTADDAERGYARLIPEPTTWQNRYTARLNLRFPGYRPVRHADRIACPILVCVCEQDGITPPEPAARVAELAPLGELRRYEGRHFDIYVGDLFERAVTDQTTFLRNKLLSA